jgi:hypothetical protein
MSVRFYKKGHLLSNLGKRYSSSESSPVFRRLIPSYTCMYLVLLVLTVAEESRRNLDDGSVEYTVLQTSVTREAN